MEKFTLRKKNWVEKYCEIIYAYLIKMQQDLKKQTLFMLFCLNFTCFFTLSQMIQNHWVFNHIFTQI